MNEIKKIRIKQQEKSKKEGKVKDINLSMKMLQ